MLALDDDSGIGTSEANEAGQCADISNASTKNCC
jgi:hypothetical protein